MMEVIPPQTVVPGESSSVSARAQNAIHRAVSRMAGATHGPDPYGETALIRVKDTAPNADGFLTGSRLTPVPPKTPGSWVEAETVFVMWVNASSAPPELPTNTFAYSHDFIGYRIGALTSDGSTKALYVVNPSAFVVPIYLASLTPTTGYYDATIDPEGGGVGSTSTCWAKCLHTDTDTLIYSGPYLGMLSGKVTNSGSERPRVLFSPFGIRSGIAGATPTDVFMQQIRFAEADFVFNGTAVELTHDADEIAVWQDGMLVGRFTTIDFIAHSTISPSVADAGGGRATVQMQLVGGPYVPESDVATAPAADKIMRADANGTSTYTPPGGTHAGLNVGSLAGDPSSPAVGDIHYNSSVGRYKIYR